VRRLRDKAQNEHKLSTRAQSKFVAPAQPSAPTPVSRSFQLVEFLFVFRRSSNYQKLSIPLPRLFSVPINYFCFVYDYLSFVGHEYFTFRELRLFIDLLLSAVRIKPFTPQHNLFGQ